MRLLIAAIIALSATACFADAPVQVGAVPSWTSVDLDPYFVRDSEVAVSSPRGLIAVMGASRSSDQTGTPDASIGIAGVTFNDKSGGRGWALYGDATHESGATWTAGLELAVKNRGANVVPSAYYLANGAYGLWIANGSDDAYGGLSVNPIAASIAIVKNSSTANVGILFARDALTGNDGTTGTATAISMPKGDVIEWRAPGNYAGASVRSDVATNGHSIQQVFVDDGVYWWAGSKVIARFKDGEAPTFGTHQTTSGATICGYVEIRDTGGTLRKLAALC